MQDRAQDPRPARTRAAISSAVESLSENGDEISVAAISAKAGISRSTFYTQFRDLDALAVCILTEAFTDIESRDLELRKTATPIETARVSVAKLVEAFARRRSLLKGVLGVRATTDAGRAVRDALVERSLDTMRAAAPAHLDPRIAAEYTAAGSLAVLTAWLLSDEQAPTERVQKQLLALLPTWLIDDERNQNP